MKALNLLLLYPPSLQLQQIISTKFRDHCSWLHHATCINNMCEKTVPAAGYFGHFNVFDNLQEVTFIHYHHHQKVFLIFLCLKCAHINSPGRTILSDTVCRQKVAVLTSNRPKFYLFLQNQPCFTDITWEKSFMSLVR